MSSRVAITCLLALAAAGCDRQSPAPGQANGTAAAVSPDEVSAPSAQGAAGIDRAHAGEAAPVAAFKDPAGQAITLAAFRGKPLLVNLWATWCGPCVAELPTLAKVSGVRVAAISQDTADAARVPAFLKEHGATGLAPYVDARMSLGTGYGASLPMTVLIDSAGREVWRWRGGNDWSGAAAGKLIAEAR